MVKYFSKVIISGSPYFLLIGRKIGMKNFLEEIQNILKCIADLKLKKLDIYVLIALNLLFSLSTLLQPLYLGKIINGIAEKSIEEIYMNIIMLVLLFLFRLFFLFLKNMRNIRIISKVEISIKEKTFEGVIKSNYKKITSNNSGKLINIIDKDAMTFSNTLNIIIGLVTDILGFVVTFFIMLIISPFLSITVIIVFPILMISYYYIGKLIKRQEYKLKTKYDNYMLFLTEALANFKVLKIFNIELKHQKKFKNILVDCYEIGIKKVRIETVGELCLQMLLLVSQTLILVLGAMMIFNGGFSIGMLVSFNSYSENFKLSAINISKINNTFQLISVSLERIKEFLDDSGNLHELSEGNNNLKKQVKKIVLKDVSYTINDCTILNHLDCVFTIGKINLIRGPSGCGKSTLFNIIAMIDTDYEGEVLINDIELNDISNTDFRSKVCLVPQETLLFSETIIDNLRMGNELISQDQIEEVCSKLKLHDFICQLEEGYNTVLKNSGKKISGGQAQRLCIARSILKDCDVYIFDEIISSLDVDNAHNVISLIDDLAKKKLVILSSHQSIENQSLEFNFETKTKRLISKEETNEILYV